MCWQCHSCGYPGVVIPVSPFEACLREVGAIHESGAGVRETSYYPALSNLLNDVGKSLKPAIRCLIRLHNIGACIPDGGLFSSQQLHGNVSSSLRPSDPDSVGLTSGVVAGDTRARIGGAE